MFMGDAASQKNNNFVLNAKVILNLKPKKRKKERNQDQGSPTGLSALNTDDHSEPWVSYRLSEHCLEEKEADSYKDWGHAKYIEE